MPRRAGLVQEGIEDGAGLVRVGKQFSVFLFVQVDADLAEESDRLLDGKGGQDSLDELRLCPAEVGGGDHAVGYVAATSAGDKDFGPEFFGAVEDDDGSVGRVAGGEDGGRQPGGPTSDNRNVDSFWNDICGHPVIVSASRSGRTHPGRRRSRWASMVWC